MDQILARQSASGAFPSQVQVGDRLFDDENGFVTALVVRALASFPSSPAVAEAAEQGLAFLLACRSPSLPGAFRFWPAGREPAWIDGLPDDADDTALYALELVRWGRRDRDWLRREVVRALLPARLGEVEPPAPPWLARGAFRTGLDGRTRGNPVDACANVNVAALLAAAGLEHSRAFHDACSTVEAGLAWAGIDPARLRSLTPFYPHPGELLHALDHAVATGVQRLRPILGRLRRQLRLAGVDTTFPDPQPVCSSAYGGTLWTAPVLQQARRLARRFRGEAGEGGDRIVPRAEP